MLKVLSLVAKAGLRDQAEVESVVAYLATKGYKPAVRAMLSALCDVADLSVHRRVITEVLSSDWMRYYRSAFMPGMEGGELAGELFLGQSCAYVLLPLSDDLLQASAFSPGDCSAFLKQFCDDLEEGARNRLDGRRVRGMDFTWKKREVRRPSFRALDETREIKVKAPDYRAADAAASAVMVDSTVRQFVKRLAQVGKIRAKDAAQLAPAEAISGLVSAGLAAEEYLLTCKQDQHTICTVSSRDELAREPAASLRCPVCSRPFSEENLQSIYSLTERAKSLITSSRWMMVWVTELLMASGMDKKQIKWSFEASGEELDIMIESFGTRVFLELKDREFGLGDSYPFVFRVTRYQGELGVVATTETVSTDAKRFFEEETRKASSPLTDVSLMEGIADIESKIPQLLAQLAHAQARRTLRPLSLRVGLDLWPVVKQWLPTITTAS